MGETSALIPAKAGQGRAFRSTSSTESSTEPREIPQRLRAWEI